MGMINLVDDTDPRGQFLMTEAELDVSPTRFSPQGFTGRSTGTATSARTGTRSRRPHGSIVALMIHGARCSARVGPDQGTTSKRRVDVLLRHWIQQEKPAETNAAKLRGRGNYRLTA